MALGPSVEVDGCSFQLTYTSSAPGGPPVFEVWLEKSQAPHQTCASPTGARVLGTSYDGIPTGAVAANVAQRLIAVTFSYRFGLSGEDYQTSTLQQVDWGTGSTLREGVFVVAGQPEEDMLPAVAVASIDVSGCNVTVRGLGKIEAPPSAGDGTHFVAHYKDFLASAPQNPAFASSAKNGD